jgi:predicted MFS family arabinose efflux permease
MSTGPGTSRAGAGISAGLVALLAVVAGVSVANLYYVQPLLPVLATHFGAGPAATGTVAVLTQAGYAVGLLLFIPLGDAVERKALILWLCAASVLALLGIAAAPSLAWVAGASFLVGFFSVVPHVALPMAAHLAAPAERGRVIGSVLAGLLTGILSARTVSGLLAEALGWRSVYLVAAAAMVGLAVALQLILPRDEPTAPLPYPALLRSLLTLARAHRDLRVAALLGAAGMGAFSAFWSTLAFHLASPAFGLGSGVAGLFGLVGVSGALAAPLVGRLADRRGPRFASGLALLLVLGAYGIFLGAGGGLAGLVAGVLLLDVGVQANQVANLARVQALDPAARSRLNTVYMVIYFVGGAAGTWSGARAWAGWGWPGVCATGAAFALAGLATWLADAASS